VNRESEQLEISAFIVKVKHAFTKIEIEYI